jgi:hypothetical protein
MDINDCSLPPTKNSDNNYEMLSDTFGAREELVDFIRTIYANRVMLWYL